MEAVQAKMASVQPQIKRFGVNTAPVALSLSAFKPF
jgi:hypothetical protein